jgi:hypothetical protein
LWPRLLYESRRRSNGIFIFIAPILLCALESGHPSSSSRQSKMGSNHFSKLFRQKPFTFVYGIRNKIKFLRVSMSIQKYHFQTLSQTGIPSFE